MQLTMKSAQTWLKSNQTLFSNATTMVMTMVINTGLGFVYWWFAAQQFSKDVVGFASAAISAMTVLGMLGTFGLGTLSIQITSHTSKQTTDFIFTSAIVTSVIATVLGVAFAVATPILSPELGLLGANLTNSILFASGVALTSLTVMLDQSLIGLMRGNDQMWRNFSFALSKLIILVGMVFFVANMSGIALYTTWMLGIVFSLVTLIIIQYRNYLHRIWQLRLRLGVLRHLGKSALAHHALNMFLDAPGRLLVIIVISLISASASASFYAAWMIASVLFVAGDALTFVLYAAAAKNRSLLSEKMRVTLSASLAIGVVGTIGLFILSDFVLSLFGQSYSEQANWCLRILGLTVFPMIIKNHYVAIFRTNGQVAQAAVVVGIGSVAELILASIGAQWGGLTGLSIGWFIAITLQAAYMYIPVHQILTDRPKPLMVTATQEA